MTPRAKTQEYPDAWTAVGRNITVVRNFFKNVFSFRPEAEGKLELSRV